ncbi:sodium-coupled monocarboxylate transporter 2-like [Babylonia areolata]|uniref:sodium-coupled monocarboxylate transporter 2-like n=1 Tax=Babylonia areolata TaxID=304850 RepID=UPI003FD584CD
MEFQPSLDKGADTSGDVSIITGKTTVFGSVDYVFFVGVLLTSAAIGFYFAWIDRHKVTIKDYMLAGGNMKVLPVSLSLVASFMSAITLLGTPVEMYQYSTVYIYIGISYILVMAAAAHIYIPVFYMLGITSTFEYLDRRFGKIIRTAASVVYIIQMMLYMSIVLYAPSLALNAVTDFPLWGAVGSVGAVCTVYTAMGGMKAVLWTDCFQVGMMIAGYLAVFIQGCIKVDGFSKAWDIMDKSGRVVFDDFDTDPTQRHTFWSLVFGGFCVWVAVYGVNQAMVQRACSLPTLRRAQIAFWLNAPGLNLILILGCLIGIVIYAFYSDCDPKKAGLISKNDQLLPLFVMDVLSEVPGLPGLFVAGLFSGALSTISSGLNAVAAVVLEDFIRAFCVKGLHDSAATRISQGLAMVFGVICLGLTYVASKLGNVLQAALMFYGMLSGPLLSAFTLGMIFPMANEWGALAGFVCSLMFGFSMGIGKFVHKPKAKPSPSPVSIAGCIFDVIHPSNTTSKPADEVSPLFSVSYLWYGFYGMIITIVVGLIVSYLTGPQDPEKLDAKLICPLFDILPPFRFLPENIRRHLRFGVVHEGVSGAPFFCRCGALCDLNICILCPS